MNTFHVLPSDALAPEAAVTVIDLMAKYGNGILVAVRGEAVYDQGVQEEVVYTDRVYAVGVAPADCRENGGRTDYIWDYVPAARWLGAHKRLVREGWFAGK